MRSRLSILLNFVMVFSIVLAGSPTLVNAAPPPAPGRSLLSEQLESLPSAISVQETTTARLPDSSVAWKDLPPELKAKVDPRILAELNGEVIPAHLGGGGPDQADVAPSERKPLERTRFIVYLKTKADLEAVHQQRFTSRVAQRNAVFDALVSTTQATQGPVKALLDTRMSTGDVAAYQPFYIFNGFAVEGDLDTVIALAKRTDVERLVANYPLVPLWKEGEAAPAPATDTGGLDPANWNIDLVDAEKVWDEFGITGEGTVVGGFDTGVDWTHPALQPQYRGYDAALGIDHNYNWFEADANLYPDGDLGPSVSTVPYDCGSHGTHTMGTMVGDGGTSGTQVGMAPDAEWIAAPGICGNTMPGGIGDDIGGLKTFQWFLCPTDLSGDHTTADCSKAPDVVNNSWGSSNPADDTFRPIIRALRAAGIAPVFASGNPSAGAGSIGSPGSAPEAITVGATDSTDTVASFSGRGPSFYEGEQKPELSAPGVNINSTVPGGGYSGASGTSMAAPAVSGLVALMVQADMQDAIRDFNVDELERFMEYTAVDLGPPGPDDDYGYGRIDAYTAVRWALSAGDLQGTITDDSTGMPIAGAMITGTTTNPGDTFTAKTGTTGAYSTTVPAGGYNIAVHAWGYQGATFKGQTVITGALSIKNFALTPHPTAQLTGQVLSGTTPISDAVVTVAAHPTTQFTTGADGAYTLTLPFGTHAMVVEATGYRVLHEDAVVASGGSTHDFAMTPAPTILLVEADAAYDWFVNRPVHNFFAWALDETHYLYDLWEIDYLTFSDTQVITGSIVGYGVPSTTTLRAYDLVIWAHTADSPSGMGFDDELMDYLDNGGHLLISGQDIGYNEHGSSFYDGYLHADYVTNIAASEGETLSGLDFLSGLSLEVTNAALHSYANTTLGLWPDAATAQDGAAYSALTYDNGNGAAALAVDPCDADYRAVYFAVGYENIGPRAYNRDPAIAQTIDDSIGWLSGSKPAYDVKVSATPTRQTDEPGSTVTYNVQVANTGAETDTFTMTVGGHAWTTRIYSGSVELTETVDIPPCNALALTLQVDIPDTANAGDKDTATVTATGNASDSADVTTVAFPLWQIETTMPTPRYRLAAVNLPGDTYYYAIGGQGNGGSTPMSANERYNACTGTWETMAPLLTAVGNIQAAVIDNKIYVPGGYDGNSSTDYDILQIYDTTTDSWSTGATLPETLWGAGVAAYDGKLYTFGGEITAGTTDRVFEYDPASDTWTEKTPMPGGARSSMAAAELDGKIYVAGGWANLRTVEVYDPATDAWSTAASMNTGRQSPGLVAAPDGYLYVSGGGNGWTGLTSAERYDPATDTWEVIPSLNEDHRAGSASAFATGRIFAVGGTGGGITNVNESLRLSDAFCLSDKAVQQSEVQPGERITYTLEIHSDAITLTTASVTDPIPDGTTWAGFGNNTAGATYNAGHDQVEWSGSLAAGADPISFTFGVDADLTGWAASDLITNTAVFDNGADQVFTRTTTTRVTFPDPAPSTKTVNVDEALAGDVLTYTVRVENASSVSDTFTMTDPIPADTTYVPGSLTYTLGTAGYDPVGDMITWTGVLSQVIYTNTSTNYEWGDSDGNGTAALVPMATVAWEDMSDATTIWNSYQDDAVSAAYPIGFDFPWFGTTRSQFYADSNGRVQFTNGGTSWGWGACTTSIDDHIAFYAGDMEVTDVAYKQFNNRTVIEFADIGPWTSSSRVEVQIILYQTGAIKLQYRNRVGSFSGGVQLSGPTGTTVVYGCPVNINNDRGILFAPPGTLYDFGTDITFAVTTTTSLPGNTWITNTATIDGPFSTVERSASTLVNPLDLSASTKTADRAWAAPGDTVTYDFLLVNTGLLTATAALTDPIPAHTTYVSGSVVCGGVCGYDVGANIITWTGEIAAGAPVTLTFAVTLTDTLVDLTPITNTATLDDGAKSQHALSDVFMARSPNLGASFKQAEPEQVHPGDTVTYTVYVRNTGFAPGDGQVYDALPPDLTYQSGSLICGSGDCGAAGGVITWTGTVPGRSMIPIQFHATVLATTSHGDLITNTATVTDVSWNTAYTVTAPIMIMEPADLWVAKQGAAAAEAGEPLVYTLTYGNAGPFNAVNTTQVVDTLPADIMYVDTAPTGIYSPAMGTVTWDVGVLNAGISNTLMLTVSIPITIPASVLTNTADIMITPRDLNSTNNSVFVTTSITPSAKIFDLRLAPVQATHYGIPGTAVNYTLEVLNTGNTTDTFDIMYAGNTWATTVNPVTIGPRAANMDSNLVVTVNVPDNAADGDTDTVTITVTSQGNPYQSASAQLTTEAGTVYDVMVIPDTTTQSDQPGTTVTYTLHVTNTGNTTDTFNLAVTGNVWTTTIPTTVGPLYAGDSEVVTVEVEIPFSARGGEDIALVTATSQGNPEKSDNSKLTTIAPPITYTLTTNMVGNGNIVVDPEQTTYTYSDIVTLTATAEPGWMFSGWSGDVNSTTDNPLVVTIKGDTVVTATFEAITYTLTANMVGNGNVVVDPEQTTYTYSDIVTLTATAEPGWTFSGWSGDVNSTTDNPLVVTIKGDTVVTATFELSSVNQLPVFTSTPITTAIVGDTYNYDVAAEDSDGDPLTITMVTGPDWLTLTDNGDGSALLAGIPISVGTFAVELSVTDRQAQDSQDFSIVVSRNKVFLPLVLRQ